MPDFSPNPFDGDDAEEHLFQQAEELMRQGRYADAAERYQDLRSSSPTSLWAILGHASALECAGDVRAAEQILDETRSTHRANAHVQRFGRMFYERREDLRQTIDCREALRHETFAELAAPPDQLADLFFNQGRYHEALNELQRVLNEEDCSENQLRASILARLGACLRQVDRADEAREHLRRAIDLEADNHWTLAELAEVERSLGNPDAARDHYRKALTHNPEDHWCRGHLAQLEFEQGNHERAIELYQAILNDEPKATWALVEMAQILSENEPERAEQLCQQALEEDPSYPWAWAQLGSIARADGRLDEARRRFQQALQASPTSTWILHELADTCRQVGRLEEAHAHLDHARSINPFDATSYGYTADILRGQDRPNEAIPHLMKAVELDSNYTWAYRELAELHALAGNHAEAEAAFREACSHQPDDPINDGLHAFLLRCSDRRAAARPFLERAVAGMPDYLWAWRELIEIDLLEGEPKQAEQHARAALEQLPDQANLLALLAEALRHQGDREAAREAVNAALKREQDVPQLWALAAELESDHDTARAREFAERAATLGHSTEYQLLRAQLTALDGDHHAAADLIDRVIDEGNQVPALAYDLAADLALQRNDTSRARHVVSRGLIAHSGDVRLAIRHAAMAIEAEEQGATHQLHQLFTTTESVPWREVAQLFAQAGELLNARRATHRSIDSCTSESQRGEAWLAAAEIELHLGQRAAACMAADRALTHNPDLPGALVMSSMLADSPAQRQRASHYLAHLDNLLLQADPEDPHHGSLLRQVALLCERLDETERADDLWERSLAIEDDSEARLEHARALHRRGEPAAAVASLRCASIRQDDPQADELVNELAQATYRSADVTQALDVIEQHQHVVGPRSRLLWAQLLCVDGRLDEADHHLDHILGPIRDSQGSADGTSGKDQSGDNQAAHSTTAAAQHQADSNTERLGDPKPRHTQRLLAARLLRIRSLLGRWRAPEAVDAARQLALDYPQDLDVAVAHAEALAMCSDIDGALAALTAEGLPSTPHLGRATLGCCLHLERDDEVAAMSWLGRHGPTDTTANSSATLRLLQNAFPGALGHDGSEGIKKGIKAAPKVSIDDSAQLPPLPRAAERIAKQIEQHQQPGLAAAVCLHAAAVAERLDHHAAAQRLRRLAVRPLIRSGQRRLAWASAYSAGAWRGWLTSWRCLLP